MVSAGNTDENVDFTVDMPASIDLPNVLSVGAVDQAGDETPFTCYGRAVRVDANGYEVESYLPGGERLALSGTSMAAPNVTNLAGKLFALDPSLTPEQVVTLILDGATRSEDGRRTLIDPKQSVEALKARLRK
jgi:subtilisin family serine protease